MKLLVNSIRVALAFLGITVTRRKTFNELVSDRLKLERTKNFLIFQSALTLDAAKKSLQLFSESKSENFQDIFVLLILCEKEEGFFVEFGATDGISGSNTHLLEKKFNWRGGLAEPARCWHASLKRSRSAEISHKLVWKKCGDTLRFRETVDAGFSTIETLVASDKHSARRDAANVYNVQTISLNQLLLDFKAPDLLDYMSIDTEGSELDILESFDFKRHRPLILTVEHNYRPDRSRLVELMTLQGYVRAPISVSKYDDWFVCHTLAERLDSIFVKESHQDF